LAALLMFGVPPSTSPGLRSSFQGNSGALLQQNRAAYATTIHDVN